jgi:predicted nucleic acid-binding protein
MAYKFFLVTTNLLDLVFSDRDGFKHSTYLVAQIRKHINLISCSAISLVYAAHTISKHNIEFSKYVIEMFATELEVIDLTSRDILEALKLGLVDLEDAFQVSAALKSKATAIVTNDKKLLAFPNSLLPICNPIKALDFIDS